MLHKDMQYIQNQKIKKELCELKVLKNILSFILAIIITILICLIFATNLLNTTVLSKNYFLSKLNEADYYNQVYVFTESNFEKYINQSGLDEEVIKNLPKSTDNGKNEKQIKKK